VTNSRVFLGHHSDVVRLAPRISRHVLARIVAHDDALHPIAETYRRVAADAERLGYTRPSYERIRMLVHEARRARLGPSTADVLIDIVMAQRPPDAIIDHKIGIPLPQRKRWYAK
jgi:hypothetical protein